MYFEIVTPRAAIARTSRATPTSSCSKTETYTSKAAAENAINVVKTHYASANSAEVGLRFQFKRRDWPVRTRARERRQR